jgi:hypothetical protein
MLTQEWTQPGDRLHTMLATSGPTQSGLVTAYAVRRPDGRVALMLINKDPGESWTVRIRLHRGATEQPLPGMARVISYSAHQYRWHAIGDHGHAQPDRPPSRRAQLARLAVTLAPTSLTVVQFRP